MVVLSPTVFANSHNPSLSLPPPTRRLPAPLWPAARCPQARAAQVARVDGARDGPAHRRVPAGPRAARGGVDGYVCGGSGRLRGDHYIFVAGRCFT
ncbi:hypothetical protein PG989_013888 [Apiospora arundinis]